MARSRKLMIATALLAGGYGLAVVVSGVSDFFWARRLIGGNGAASNRGIVDLTAGSIGGLAADGTARLVPESTTNREDCIAARRGPVPTASAATQPVLPTWLVPVPQVGANGATRGKQNEPTTATEIVASSTAAPIPAGTEERAAATQPWPRARLTDATQAGVAALGRATQQPVASASPWDRWPRWDPPAEPVVHAAIGDQEQAGAPAETASVGVSSSPRTHQASFNGPAGPAGPAEAAFDGPAEMRIHIVIDGDSLARLADRYLDDPQLADAIYQLNRDVLTDPELLPIGTELKIPERRMASTSQVGLPPRDVSRPAVRPTSSLPTDDSAWEPAHRAPRAQLLRPQPPTGGPATIPPSSSW